MNLTGQDADVTGELISAQTVAIDTRNGDVDLPFADAPMSVKIQSQDGDVRLELPAVEYRVQVTTKKGDQNVRVNKSDSSDHMIDVATRSGDVTILPAA